MDPDKECDFDADDFVRSLTQRPGVYRMLDAAGEVLYVGKASNLKNRVSSYFRHSGLPHKTRSMMAQVRSVEVTLTQNESEALLLENQLIKRHRPRYNILLRDDKSYPYIFISSAADTRFPRLGFHRGAQRMAGRYFGPYPGAGAARETLNLLQKLFCVRQCEDSFFRNRSRPCLQYQIKRCSAPCVGYISEDDYRKDVELAEMFLEGKNTAVVDALVKRMEAASERLEFETAARYRDQISSLRRIQDRQYVSGQAGNVDVVACTVEGQMACVQVFFVRGGRSLGNKAFYPKLPPEAGADDVLGAFLPQYYLDKAVPEEVLLSHAVNDLELLEQTLTAQAGRRVRLASRVRGERAKWMRNALDNARYALNTRMASRSGMLQRFEALQDALSLEQTPARVECFDISHTMGEATVASCVVFDQEGAVKSDYRRFNIGDIEPGDDYAAMRQALQRRYTRLKKGEGKLPDLLLIDGGKGQVRQAEEVLEELQVEGVQIVGIAKGPERKAGMETLLLSGHKAPFILPEDSMALHLLQQVRDEAHRFAITGHRQRRSKARTTSPLEQIPGMGPKRRQRLLQQFGGLREVARAGVDDLAGVQGISRELAQRIYDVFHSDVA